MHPPPFSPTHRLSDWPECILDLHCKPCGGRTVHSPVRLLLARHGDVTFERLVAKLRCRQCGNRPAPVHLMAGFHRTDSKGPPACWAVELVAAQR